MVLGHHRRMHPHRDRRWRARGSGRGAAPVLRGRRRVAGARPPGPSPSVLCAGVDALGDGEELDDVAQAAGEGDITGGEGADALAVHVGGGDLGAEDDAGHDGSLGGGVAAVHIRAGVGLGEAQGLRLGEGVGVAGTAGGHAAEDVVGGAVDDAHDAAHRLAGQGLPQRPHERDGAAHRRLEQQVHAGRPGRGEEFGAVSGQDLLVGGHHRLAARQSRQQQLPGGVDAADELHHDVDLGMAHHGRGVAGEQVGRHAGAGTVRRANRDRDGHELGAAAGGDLGAPLLQKLHERSADRAAAQDAHADPPGGGRGTGRSRRGGDHPCSRYRRSRPTPGPRPAPGALHGAAVRPPIT